MPRRAATGRGPIYRKPGRRDTACKSFTARRTDRRGRFVDIMGMQDITGHFALPLAYPYADVPPPYGRRRTPFVNGKRPRARVFDLGTVRGASEMAHVAVIHATDFGSENRPWINAPRPRRRWRPTLLALLAGVAFGSVGVAGAHLFDAGHRMLGRARPQDTVYEAAISVAPVAASDQTRRTNEAASTVSTYAMPSTAPKHSRADAIPAAPRAVAKPAGSRRKTGVRPSTPSDRPAAEAHRAPVQASAPSSVASPHVESAQDASAAVGMSAAEFTRWLAGTRESARATASPTHPDGKLIELTHQTRLTDR